LIFSYIFNFKNTDADSLTFFIFLIHFLAEISQKNQK
jgi:hypothetical protein